MKPRTSPRVERAKNAARPERRRINPTILERLAERLDVHCAMTRQTPSAVLEDLLERFVPVYRVQVTRRPGESEDRRESAGPVIEIAAA